jgi:hypothetical protein
MATISKTADGWSVKAHNWDSQGRPLVCYGRNKRMAKKKARSFGYEGTFHKV